MRAVVKESFTDAPVLRDIPRPVPGPGELLVRTVASSINAFDRAVVAGYLEGRMEHRFPVVLGRDFSGTVEAVGEATEQFRPGDRVFGMLTGMILGDGAFAEYLVVPEALGVARAPDGLDLVEAGALGIAGVTAMRAVDAAGSLPGRSILVVGATGSVGSYAIQLAAGRGARVIATARSDETARFARDLGAADVVEAGDGLASRVRAIVPDGVDAVIHLAGDGSALAEVVAPGGTIASTAGLGPDAFPGRDLSVVAVIGYPEAGLLDSLAALVVAGGLRVPITRRYQLPEVPRAFASPDHVIGKAAVVVDASLS